MSEPLPSGLALGSLGVARRWIRALVRSRPPPFPNGSDPTPPPPPFLLSCCCSFSRSRYSSSPLSLSLSLSLVSPVLRLFRLYLDFVRLGSPLSPTERRRRPLRCCAHRNKSKHPPRGRHGATKSRWMDPRGAVSRSPGIIARPPWGFNRPEVRHQRDTCSTLTILLA